MEYSFNLCYTLSDFNIQFLSINDNTTETISLFVFLLETLTF